MSISLLSSTSGHTAVIRAVLRELNLVKYFGNLVFGNGSGPPPELPAELKDDFKRERSLESVITREVKEKVVARLVKEMKDLHLPAAFFMRDRVPAGLVEDEEMNVTPAVFSKSMVGEARITT